MADHKLITILKFPKFLGGTSGQVDPLAHSIKVGLKSAFSIASSHLFNSHLMYLCPPFNINESLDVC